MTLSAERLAQLELDANAGAAAATQLSEQTFTHAWEKALTRRSFSRPAVALLSIRR